MIAVMGVKSMWAPYAKSKRAGKVNVDIFQVDESLPCPSTKMVVRGKQLIEPHDRAGFTVYL